MGSDCISSWSLLIFLRFTSCQKHQQGKKHKLLIFISLWIDCLFEIHKIAVSFIPLAFFAGWLQGHWWGFISRNYVAWPSFFLMNVFIALKGSHFWFLFKLKERHQVWTSSSRNSAKTISWTKRIKKWMSNINYNIQMQLKTAPWNRSNTLLAGVLKPILLTII